MGTNSCVLRAMIIISIITGGGCYLRVILCKENE